MSNRSNCRCYQWLLYR
ncbi:hypothetical protein Goshw_008657 [Gossypium schwendimanii]|uniref:Uncharacterized protein n=1 Tax=Gossypium schwendimanii TaxID=34291 RepID=A0A7J9L8N9_GOSSC|nr:hypothetical protein [Gossypium schwendimanii]